MVDELIADSFKRHTSSVLRFISFLEDAGACCNLPRAHTVKTFFATETNDVTPEFSIF